MKEKAFDKKWTKKDTLRSATLFLLQFILTVLVVILAIVIGGLSLGNNIADFDAYLKRYASKYLYALFSSFLLFTIMYFYFYFEDKEIISTGKNVVLLFTIINVSLIINYFIGLKIDLYARPVALTAFLAVMLVSRREAMFLNIVSTLLMFIIDTFTGADSLHPYEYYTSLLLSFSSGMIAIFFCNRAKTRFSVVAIGIFIVLPIDFMILLLEISTLLDSTTTSFQRIVARMGYGLFGGVTSAVLFLAILPVFEIVFNCLTAFRLRELTSSDAKILKKLKQEAPGTYNHVIMVAQLAEAAAAAIGENVDYARAAALYHDVGKLHNPEHFTENQGDYNLHDELTPELSADIIRSHAHDGYALIKSNHLPEFLADVALQHHGTMPIRYFYAKALKLTDGELNIEDFSYLGPKPQTKVAAIVMIADASEAVVRAVGARSPEETEKAIRTVIEERMDLEQFAECDITLADLTKIRQALVSALSGVYHHRVKYPNIKYRRTSSGKTKGEN